MTARAVPLDRQAADAMARVAALRLPAAWQVPIGEARANYLRSRAILRAEPAVVDAVEDLRAGGVALRRYRGIGTASEATTPAIVYFHGGGWVFGNLDSHDAVCRQLANALRGQVFAVDYRLAPEHRFPAAVDDAIAATAFVSANAGALAIHPERLGVAGDSAGGNLAAVVAIDARDRGGPRLAVQGLVYPALDFDFGADSHRTLASGYMLTAESLVFYRDAYLRDAADRRDWRASPLVRSDLAGLPEAYILTAGYDPLRDEGRLYAERLHAAGVDVTYECFQGMIHGFVTMGGAVAAAPHAITRLAAHLRQGFGLAPPPRLPRPRTVTPVDPTDPDTSGIEDDTPGKSDVRAR